MQQTNTVQGTITLPQIPNVQGLPIMLPQIPNTVQGLYTITGGRINTVQNPYTQLLNTVNSCNDCHRSFISGHLINRICVYCSNKNLEINIKCSCGKVFKSIDEIFVSGECCTERLFVELMKERDMYKQAFIQVACVAQRLKSQQ